MASLLDSEFLAAFRAGRLTREQAEAVAARLDQAGVALVLLQLSAAVAPSPNAPSSAVPPFQKETAAPGKRKRKKGAKPGHKGSARPDPGEPDEVVEVLAPVCPDCGGGLNRTGRVRRRVYEDIPEAGPVVTEVLVHGDWCAKCKKVVEGRPAGVLPNCRIGNRVTALSAWWHYGLGTTTSQVRELLGSHLKFKLTDGGLTQLWHRLAEVLTPWYEQIRAQCLRAGVLHGDETGWRVNGETHWLWCFATKGETLYLIDRSRGHAALDKVFTEAFDGILVTDFWSAYDHLDCAKQKCWAHLTRECVAVGERKEASSDWHAFAKRLRRLYADATRLAAERAKLAEDDFRRKADRLVDRVYELARAEWTDADARRLAGRLERYGAELLLFVEDAAVPPDNNRAEREIRPAVMQRKTGHGNQSERGCRTREVLMSVHRTLRLRKLDPLEETMKALAIYAATDKLPDMPASRG